MSHQARRIRRLEVVVSPTISYGWVEIVRGEYDAAFREELARLVAEGLAKPSTSLQRCYEYLSKCAGLEQLGSTVRGCGDNRESRKGSRP